MIWEAILEDTARLLFPNDTTKGDLWVTKMRNAMKGSNVNLNDDESDLCIRLGHVRIMERLAVQD